MHEHMHYRRYKNIEPIDRWGFLVLSKMCLLLCVIRDSNLKQSVPGGTYTFPFLINMLSLWSGSGPDTAY
jgi:hypothetical protein